MRLAKNCKTCGKEFYKKKQTTLAEWNGTGRSNHVVKYCSPDCKNKGWLGRSPANKGKPGIPHTEAFKKHMSRLWRERREISMNYKFSGSKWSNTRKYVLTRDDYTCQICGLRDMEIMEVDHIRPKARFPELTYISSNCLSLCPNCHARKTRREKREKLLSKPEQPADAEKVAGERGFGK